MKVGDIVRCREEAVGGILHWVFLIVGHGDGDWDWELYHAGNEYQEPFTWYAAEEELELIE